MTQALNVFSIPRALPQEIKRPLLIQKLREASHLKMIALLAPSGFGKTTLLAQFARLSKQKTIWVSLGVEDSDIVPFVQKLIQALQNHKVFPTLNFQFSNMHHLSFNQLQLLILQHLSDLRENIKIIFDKTEHLSEESVKWLQSFMFRLPEGHQILLSGYDTSALPVQEWKDSTHALVLGIDLLVFTEQEAQAFTIKNKLPWSTDWFKQTQGWPVGVALKLSRNTHDLDAIDLVLHAVEELPQDIKTGLMQLAGTPVWNTESTLWDGTAMPSHWLDQVHACGLPLAHLENHHYVPHTLLLQALEKLLSRDPVLQRGVHLHHAQKHESQGLWLQAMEHYLKANSIDDALRVLGHLLPVLLQRPNLSALRGVLQKFKVTDLTERLQAYLALAYLDTQNHKEGFRILEDLQQRGVENAVFCFGKATIALKQSNSHEVFFWLERGLEIADNDQDRGRLRRLRAFVLFRTQRYQEALSECDFLLQSAMESQNYWETARLYIYYANIYFDLGHNQLSEEYYWKALEISRSHQFDTITAQIAQNFAPTLMEVNRPIEGIALLNEALKIPSEILLIWEPSLFGMRGALHEYMGLFELAIQDYEKTIELAEKYGMQDAVLRHTMAIVISASMSNNVDLARKNLALVEIQLNQNEESNIAYYNQCLGLYNLATNNLEKAREAFIAMDIPVLTDWERAQIPFFLAEISRRQGTPHFKEIQTAFERLDSIKSDAPLYALNRSFYDLMLHCIQENWYTERLKPIIKQRDDLLNSFTSCYKIHLQGFNRLNVTSSSKSLKVSLKKSLELLVLLALRKKQTRDQLIDQLWDGKNNEKIQDHFRVLIRKLRSDLSKAFDTSLDLVPYQNGMYSLDPSVKVEFDVADFLGLTSSNCTTSTAALLYYSEVILPTISSEWAEKWRQQCKVHHIHLLLSLPSDDPATLVLVRKGLELHPESTALHACFQQLSVQHPPTTFLV